MTDMKNCKLHTFLLIRISNSFRVSIFLKFSGFESKITLKIFLSVKVVASSGNEGNSYIQIFVDALIHHKANQKKNGVRDIAPIVQKLICKLYYNSNTQNSKSW